MNRNAVAGSDAPTSPDAGAPLVELRNVYKFFGGLCAVNNVSLAIGRGEVIGLVGDTRCGPSRWW